MPVVVEVKSKEAYATWVADAEAEGGRGLGRPEQGLV